MPVPASRKQGKKFFPVFPEYFFSNSATKACRRVLDLVGDWYRRGRNAPDYVREVVRDIPISICAMDGPALRIAYANDAFRKLVGAKGVLVGRESRKVLGKAMPACFFELVARVLESGEAERAQDVLARFTDGEGRSFSRYLDFECRPKPGREGTVGGVIFLAVDVTAKVQAMERAEHRADSLRAEMTNRDEFFSIASHELKSPITSLKLQLQMTQRKLSQAPGDAPETAKIAEALSRSTDQVDRITGLVDDLMDLTRISNGQMTFDFGSHSVSDLVRETLRRFEDQLAASRCPLETRIEPDLRAEIDRSRIEQVVVNLVSNAIKYAPGARLEVEAREVSGGLELSFRDHGPGIPKASQRKLFERFERVQPASKATGLGLGLFIVKQIVEGHGGSVSVESAENQGAKFVVRLPKRVRPDRHGICSIPPS